MGGPIGMPGQATGTRDEGLEPGALGSPLNLGRLSTSTWSPTTVATRSSFESKCA